MMRITIERMSDGPDMSEPDDLPVRSRRDHV